MFYHGLETQNVTSVNQFTSIKASLVPLSASSGLPQGEDYEYLYVMKILNAWTFPHILVLYRLSKHGMILAGWV